MTISALNNFFSISLVFMILILVKPSAGCFKFTTCNPKTENQNIHAYGLVLIVSNCVSTQMEKLTIDLEMVQFVFLLFIRIQILVNYGC